MKSEIQTLGMMFRYIRAKFSYMDPKATHSGNGPFPQQSNKRFRSEYINRFLSLCTNMENKSLTLEDASKHSFFKNDEETTIMMRVIYQDLEHNKLAKSEISGSSTYLFHNNWLEGFSVAHRDKIVERNNENLEFQRINSPAQYQFHLQEIQKGEQIGPKYVPSSSSTEISKGFNPKIDTHPVYNFRNAYDAYRMFRNDMTHNQYAVEQTLKLKPFGLLDVFTSAMPMFVCLGETLWKKYGGASSPIIPDFNFPKRTPYYNAAIFVYRYIEPPNSSGVTTENFNKELLQIMQDEDGGWEKPSQKPALQSAVVQVLQASPPGKSVMSPQRHNVTPGTSQSPRNKNTSYESQAHKSPTYESPRKKFQVSPTKKSPINKNMPTNKSPKSQSKKATTPGKFMYHNAPTPK